MLSIDTFIVWMLNLPLLVCSIEKKLFFCRLGAYVMDIVAVRTEKFCGNIIHGETPILHVVMLTSYMSSK